MAALQAKVLYDFEGDTANGELSIHAGDIVAVSSQDVGEGWWEGSINGGPLGLFPATYVEICQRPPSMPPHISVQGSEPRGSISSSYSSTFDQYEQIDGRLDPNDWNDNVSSASDTFSEDYNFGTTQQRSNTMSRTGTVRKSMNRFSNFVKSGGEDFLLGNKAESTIPQHDQLVTIDGPDGIAWQPNSIPFTIKITEPEKKSKYKGMKSYISYNLQPSHTSVIAGHRFKHFDWLYERLFQKFPCISIPPLPDKQLTGRYSEDLVKKRRYLLEKWINRVARHPVLAQSMVFEHFISVCSETREKEWKDGKRKAETDKVVGAQFFYTIYAPQLNLSMHKVETEVDSFKDFVKNMDDGCKKMIEIGENHWDKVSRSYKNEYKKLASGLQGLSTAFATDNAPYSLALTQAMNHTGGVYSEIGDMCQEQPKKDMLQVLEVLREYTGMLSTYPEIITVHKGALSKVKECQKLQEEEKLKYSEVADISQRMDVVSSAMFAEIHHFQRERCRDFKEVMQSYLKEQISFHQDIISRLSSSLAMYDQVPD
ncbi:sorting nexin-18-like [Hydractinia symbiolongicarpus]|uniref:sorting nexin-18-like n=1 Tax=Hydractinia symbiolongicarpus TaxID=13093 RepID=UPI00254A9A12|nr:sorting nexin-18-like [Hydractinia symbiolongicarpus]XP_057297850.1 sorting nexin-18-like [Hydractinia symbiolongicarpus]